MKKLFLIFCLIIILIPVKLFSQTLRYEVVDQINIGGEGWWDYVAVDTSINKLFVTHGTKIHIIDLNSKKIIGEISNLNGVHGIAFANEFEKGFISNGRNDKVTVINLKTFKVIGSIHVTGKDPDAIVYDNFTKRVFAINGHSSNITAIDAKTNKIVGTIKLDGSPEFCVSNEKGLMYVNLEDKSKVEEFNPKSLEIINEWSLAPGEGPSGLGIDIKNNILFSGCHNKLMSIFNAVTGKVITTLPIGGHVDGCEFDPKTDLIFSSNGEGNVTVIKEISPDKFKVIENLKTGKGFRTIALDPTTHKIYLPGMIKNTNKESFGVLVLAKK